MAESMQVPSHFKPGKTVNQHERHFVVHKYTDFANEPDDPSMEPTRRRKGGVTIPFPVVLHRSLTLIEKDGLGHIFGWRPHGRCFVIAKPKLFVSLILPKYFKLSKLSSFQRQLNLYGFNRLTRGEDASGYYHEFFLRDREFLARRMMRQRIKGTKIKGAYNPDYEPNFYSMPFVDSRPDSDVVPVASTTDSLAYTSDDASSHSEMLAPVFSASSSFGIPRTKTTNATPRKSKKANQSPKQPKAVCNFVFPQYSETCEMLQTPDEKSFSTSNAPPSQQLPDSPAAFFEFLDSHTGTSLSSSSAQASLEADTILLDFLEMQSKLLGQSSALDSEIMISEAV